MAPSEPNLPLTSGASAETPGDRPPGHAAQQAPLPPTKTVVGRAPETDSGLISWLEHMSSSALCAANNRDWDTQPGDVAEVIQHVSPHFHATAMVVPWSLTFEELMSLSRTVAEADPAFRIELLRTETDLDMALGRATVYLYAKYRGLGGLDKIAGIAESVSVKQVEVAVAVQ